MADNRGQEHAIVATRGDLAEAPLYILSGFMIPTIHATIPMALPGSKPGPFVGPGVAELLEMMTQ